MFIKWKKHILTVCDLRDEPSFASHFVASINDKGNGHILLPLWASLPPSEQRQRPFPEWTVMALEIGKQLAHSGTQLKVRPFLCPKMLYLGTVFQRKKDRSVSRLHIRGDKDLLILTLLIERNGINHRFGRNGNESYTELSIEPGSAPSCTTLICGHGLLRLLPLTNYGSYKLALRSHTIT